MVAFLLYAVTVSYGYVAYDDPWLIASNPLLTQADTLDLWRVLFDFTPSTRMILGAEYLPVRDVSTWLDGALCGEWVGGRHLVNALLYGLAVALFGSFAMRAFRRVGERGRFAAWTSTMLFAVHPTHVEAVAWLSERKGLLSLVFVLAAVLCAERYIVRARRRNVPLALLWYSLAVFSKSVSVVAPAFAAGLAGFTETRAGLRRTLVLTGALFFFGLLLIQPTLSVGGELNVIQPEHSDSLFGRALLVCELHGRYLALMTLAVPNAPHYLVDATVANPFFVSLGLLGFGGAGVLLARAKRNPVGACGALWWLAGLFPVSHLLFPLQNLMADRYLLLPSVGFCLLVGEGASRLAPRLRALPAAAFVSLALGISILQIPTWQNSETLFQRLVELQPEVDAHWSQWAAELSGQGARDKALSVTLAGIEQAGETPALLHRRGLLLLERGEAELGFADIENAALHVEATPKYQANYALLLLNRGRLDDAQVYASLAAKRAPLYAHIQRVLGLVELRRGNVTAAREAFENALALEPNNPVNVRNLAAVRGRSG